MALLQRSWSLVDVARADYHLLHRSSSGQAGLLGPAARTVAGGLQIRAARSGSKKSRPSKGDGGESQAGPSHSHGRDAQPDSQHVPKQQDQGVTNAYDCTSTEGVTLSWSELVAANSQDVSRTSYEGFPFDPQMEVGAERSRISFEGTENSPKNAKSEEKKKSKSFDPDNQWQNVFPSYMQSKADESDEVLDGGAPQARQVQLNGKPRPVVNGLAAKKAAAAATASAKALESHVTTSPSLSVPPCSSARPPAEGGHNLNDLISHDPIWAAIRAEARLEAEREPLLSSFLYASILAHPCFERSLGFILANRLKNPTLLATQLMDVFDDVFSYDVYVQEAIRLDVQALKDRDPSCRSYSSAVLYLKILGSLGGLRSRQWVKIGEKGYHALQAYRVAHVLWNRGQQVFALALQSRISEVFAVDIHPAARIGKAVLLDHGTGVVIGETAVIGDRVSLMQGVTLGGTGKDSGDRHPKIRGGVLIGAGATILGNIVVGKGAMIAAGSLVLKDVPPHGMVAGTPAKLIGILEEPTPALTMQHDVTRDFCLDLEAAVRRQLVEEHELYGGAGI